MHTTSCDKEQIFKGLQSAGAATGREGLLKAFQVSTLIVQKEGRNIKITIGNLDTSVPLRVLKTYFKLSTYEIFIIRDYVWDMFYNERITPYGAWDKMTANLRLGYAPEST